MSSWITYKQFDRYVEAFGNRFAAINYVASVARRRRNAVHNCITESEALDWVVSGIEPTNLRPNLKLYFKHKNRTKEYVNDRLCYILDDEVRLAVKYTINNYKESGHLIYNYNNISDRSRQARVRVLSNIIQDELKQIEIEDMI